MQTRTVRKRFSRSGVISACSLLLQLSATAQAVEFQREVLPILANNCFHCHGPDESSREADLRLDLQSGIFSQHDGLRIVAPHAPEQSELFRRISADDPDERMPPPDSEYQLSSEQIATIRRWIEAGAVWSQHWSFVPPVKQPVPDVETPEWCHNSIDHFVLARLEAAGVEPSPQADRRTLIRRLAFDLTGLPPSVNDVHEFVADTSPEAYEKLVDRLLESPQYGEHRARYWLDAARYGDTHGLHVDNYREMWPYRDYVIRAFNSNMPYDRFLVEQLAGDLLPEPTLDQQIASGFNRCHVTTNEGGSIAEEVYVRDVIDRVSTFGTAMMGLTLGCCVCHNHKFDPLTQQDFYELFAFFNSLDGPEMDGNTKQPAPYVLVPTSKQSKRLAELQEHICNLRQENEQRVASLDSLSHDDLAGGVPVVELLESSEITGGLVHHYRLGEGKGTSLHGSSAHDKPGRLRGAVIWTDGLEGPALRFSESGYADLGNTGDLTKEKPFSLGLWINVPDPASGTVLARMNVKDLEKGYLVALEDGHVIVKLSSRWPGYAIKVTSVDALTEPGRWHHVFITYDGKEMAHGVKLYVDGLGRTVEVNCDSLLEEGSIDVNVPLRIGRRDQDPSFAGLAVSDLRIYDRRLRDDEVRALYLAPIAARAARSATKHWSDEQTRAVRELAAMSNDGAYRETAEQIDELQRQYCEELTHVPTTPVFRKLRHSLPAYVLIRGQYDQLGDQVQRNTPAVLPPLDSSLPRDRLGLAQWLVSDEHPLTSRVAVNNFWQQLFGCGLVETSEDFGIQGSPPSHPELLDWLACEFRDKGWNVKALLKSIVMSATYQQSSCLTPAIASRDPKNRLLARGPRYRLDAEMLRDQALAVSGLLVQHVGGPSVKPPQPEGLWEAVAITNSNTAHFQADHSPQQVYRRSVYTFWKRTSPPPQMAILDAPSREVCTVRRERTNTPLQALLLMNETQYLEAARSLAERMLREPVASPADRLRWGFEEVTLRHPSAVELQELLSAYETFSKDYASDLAAAEAVIHVGELPPDEEFAPEKLAVWTMVSNLLLNLDEVVTKE